MKNNSRFAKGSGVYKCHSCGRSTRATGANLDAVDLRLCGECYEIGGIENQISDNPNHADVPKWEAEIEQLKARITERGGNADNL